MTSECLGHEFILFVGKITLHNYVMNIKFEENSPRNSKKEQYGRLVIERRSTVYQLFADEKLYSSEYNITIKN